MKVVFLHRASHREVRKGRKGREENPLNFAFLACFAVKSLPCTVLKVVL